MRLTEAISRIANDARTENRPLPIILMPRSALLSFSRALEKDVGSNSFMFDPCFRNGQVMYDGVTFAPLTAKPRIRVKAPTRRISMDAYAYQQKWRTTEFDLLFDYMPVHGEKRIGDQPGWMSI